MDNQDNSNSPQTTAQPVAEQTVENTVEQPSTEVTPNETVETPSTPETTQTDAIETKPEPEGNGETKSDTESNSPVNSLVLDAGLTAQEINEAFAKSEGKTTAEIKEKLVEKHGEAVGELLAQQLETQYKTATEAAKAKDQAVYDQVAKEFEGVTEQSGEDSWKELATWSKENVPNDVRKELNTLLQQGGLAAKLAVRELSELYKENNFAQDAKLMEADGAGDTNVEILDKATYDREVRKLMNEGHDYATSPKIQQLKRNRTKAINRGM